MGNLQEFDFTLKYRPGVTHQNVDGLSRQAWVKDRKSESLHNVSPRTARAEQGGDVELARGVAELHPLEEDKPRSSLGKKAQSQPC